MVMLMHINYLVIYCLKSNTYIVTPKILEDYDLSLEDNVYAKIWSNLSNRDKDLCYAISESANISDILTCAKLNN